jgi:hypothetical protein
MENQRKVPWSVCSTPMAAQAKNWVAPIKPVASLSISTPFEMELSICKSMVALVIVITSKCLSKQDK